MNGDPAREFLDTNVVVYAYDVSAGDKHVRALELLDDLASTERGALSVQVLQELFVTLTMKVPEPLAVREAAHLVSDLGAMPTHAPGVDDVVAAIEVHRRLRLSFWDAMILHSAKELGCGVLWSEDFSHGKRYNDTEVRNPFI